MLSKYSAEKAASIEGFMDFMEGKALPPHPLNVFLEVSNLCNMSCFMCVLFSSLNQTRTSDITSRERGFLQFDEMAQRLEKIAPHLLSVHLFGYGEPTIHPHFRSFVEFFARHEVMIDFFTNGMKLDEDLSKFLVDCNVFNVTFSFSGATKEEYENVYLGGNFDTVTGNIRRLAAEKERQGKEYPRISINSIAFEHHNEKFDQFVELMASIGVNEISVKPLQEYGEKIDELQGHASDFKSNEKRAILQRALATARDAKMNVWIHPDLMTAGDPIPEAIRSVIPISEIKKIAQSKKKVGGKAEKIQEVPSPLAQNSRKSAKLLLGNTVEKKDFVCPEPFHTLYISQDGSVRPCCFWSSFSTALGSLKRNNASQIWNGGGVKALQSLVLEGRYPEKGCGHCLDRNLAPFEHHPWHFIREYKNWSDITWGENQVTEIEFSEANGVSKAKAALLESHPELIVEKKTSFMDVWDFCRQVPYSKNSFNETFSGQVDLFHENAVWGWVFYKENPELRLPVEITAGNRVIGRVTAYEYREDLKAHGYGDGRYGFGIQLDNMPLESMTDLRVRIEGTDWSVPLSDPAIDKIAEIKSRAEEPLETQAMK